MTEFGIPVIDPALAERLGQVVVRWSTVEYLISLLLSTFLQADHGGMMIVTNNIAASTQSRWLRALMSQHDHEAEQSARVAALLDRLDDLRTERNEFVHGTWDPKGCEPETALVETVSLERSEIIRSRLVTLQDLKQFVIEIDGWIDDYVELGRELGFPRRSGETKSIFAD